MGFFLDMHVFLTLFFQFPLVISGANSCISYSLDTFPYAGTTTTCESLYMGVPCVTMAGAVHAHNVGVSLLSNVGEEHSFYISGLVPVKHRPCCMVLLRFLGLLVSFITLKKLCWLLENFNCRFRTFGCKK